MFDWNDEELSNIIWGETGGDHIVPFQDENVEDYHRKNNEWNQEGTTVKPSSDQRNPEAKGDFYGRKPKDGLSSELSLSKNDQYSHVLYTSSVEMAELDKGPENFQSALEGKEQGDFVDYSWANIGSFDDLDRILSDDDPIFGHVSLDSADELWPSSKDVTNDKPFPITEESSSFELGALRETSQHLDTKTEDEPPFIPNYALQSGRNIPGGKSKPTVKEKRDLVTGGKATALNSHPAAEKAKTPYQLSDKLSNIIWGETGDHIVPFQDENEDFHREKNEWSREGTTFNPSSDQRNPEAKGDFHGRKLKGGLSSELSLFNAAKNDQDSHIYTTQVLKQLSLIKDVKISKTPLKVKNKVILLAIFGLILEALMILIEFSAMRTQYSAM